MSVFSVLSEMEKSSDRTEIKKFSREIWSNNTSKAECTAGFQNEFINVQEEFNQHEKVLTFRNENHDSTMMTFSDNFDSGDLANKVKTTVPKRVDIPSSPSNFENLQESDSIFQSEINHEATKNTFSNTVDINIFENKENIAIPRDDDIKTSISHSEKQNREGLSNTELRLCDVDYDATDYFDSEDEYFENYKNNFEDDRRFNFHEMVYSPSSTSEKTGRYSQGISQYYNMPVFIRSLKTFANANGFTLKDVMADGNCLFRAIDDQLSVKGIFGNSPDSLRKYTLKFLRENPYQEDGSHTESFLFSESWEQYLSRMEQNTEWCDHVILKAAVDALGLRAVVFNVYGDDIRRTEVLSRKQSAGIITIYIGHFGEFHYLSLRPNTWDKEWQYKALMFRYKLCIKEMDPSSSKQLLIRKLESMRIQSSENNELQGLLGMKSNDELQTGKQTESKHTVSDELGYCLCPAYGLKDLCTEENEDLLRCLVEDPFYTDTQTGLPLPHLTYLIMHLIPQMMLLSNSRGFPPVRKDGKLFEYIGSYATATHMFLKDISRGYTLRNKVKKNATVVAHDVEPLSSTISIETGEVHPGFLRLRVSPSQQKFQEKSLYRHDGKVFLKRLEVPKKMALPELTERCFMGFAIGELPIVADEWRYRRRKFHWPSNNVVIAIQKAGCTIIPKHHPQSSNPEIEWKFNFSSAEVLIFTRATTSMQWKGFSVLKVLTDQCMCHLKKRLKLKHIKAVFCNCCEQIPVDAWETSFSGCILYALTYLLACLKQKNLSHYFISSQNLLDSYTEDETEAIRVQVEALRLFPIQTMIYLDEDFGYTYGANLAKFVLQDCRRFASDRDIISSYREVFVPGTIRTAKFFTRKGYYGAAFYLLCDTCQMYECFINTEPSDLHCNFAEVFCNALSEIHQEASRTILAKKFENEYGINIMDSVMKTEGLFVKDILPWEVNYQIANLHIPMEKTSNFELIGEFFYEFSKTEVRRFNSDLATLGISEAIQCFERAIQEGIMIAVEIDDESLKNDIQSQKSEIKKRLKEKLKDCYIHTLWISKMHRTFLPLEMYMPAIEELCKELPEMSGIVSMMYQYLHYPGKQKEYEKKL